MFGERLKKSRKYNKLSQKDLAKKVGVSRKVISNYETNDSKPTSDNLSKLAEALNVSSDYLLGFTSEYSQNIVQKEKVLSVLTDLALASSELERILSNKFLELLEEIKKI